MSLRRIAVFIVLLCYVTIAGASSTPYIITEFPVAPVSPDTKVWIKWAGASRNPLNERYMPDSGKIYFSTSPGGSIIRNYSDSVTFAWSDTTISGFQKTPELQNNVLIRDSLGDPVVPPQRGIKFRPMDQANMGAGVYYMMVAWKTKNLLPPYTDTTFFSNEISMIVEADKATSLVAPAMDATITQFTPTFSWERNPGVPYYHVIVSDEEIVFNVDSQSISGLSIIWQAITPNTQLTYGAPDPSGTLTANPPPLSPGKTYSWVVLNNYGNHPAYTSQKFGLPRNFTIAGQSLVKPVNAFPRANDTLDALTNDTLTFKWSNLDKTRANTYKIYLYVGSDFEGVGAQMVVWENEVSAGQFTGDSAWATIDAKSILTSNYYTWKVIAVDASGAGTSGEITGFRYSGVPSGTLRVYTRENIDADGTNIVRNVAAVKIQVDVLDGSLEAPLLFYTDNSGILSRVRPTGQYRLTAIKNGYQPQTKTVVLSEDEVDTSFFYLERPDATIFGRVFDESARPVDLAEVVGISDFGDTIVDETDNLGNFVLNCYAADWRVWVRKNGYVSTVAQKVTVISGQSVNFGSVTVSSNPYTLSGVVKNTTNLPILGATVQLLRDGVVVSTLPSTPQNGGFSFSVTSGTYSLKITKTGFVSAIKEGIDVTGSKQVTVVLSPGAAIIKGAIIGRTWGPQGRVFAPITNARIVFTDTTSLTLDSVVVVSGATYGDFSVSVSGGKVYRMKSSASGFLGKTYSALFTTIAGNTTEGVKDTLLGLAYVKGLATLTSTNDRVGDVTVSLLDTATSAIVAYSKTDSRGIYEIRDIPNGAFRIQAGVSGKILDTAFIIDTSKVSYPESLLVVEDGRAVKLVNTQRKIVDSLNVRMRVGDKSVGWAITLSGVNSLKAAIKVRSPLQKTLKPGDTLSGVGAGTYLAVVDADDDSVLDAVSHRTVIPASGAAYMQDVVILPFSHVKPESLWVDANGKVSVTVRSVDVHADSIKMFFRDINATVFDTVSFVNSPVTAGAVRTYTFMPSPRKNGSFLTYYFKAWAGTELYGYDQELYTSYIRPDTATLTKLDIYPSAEDTVLLPAGGSIQFTVNGYFGSGFIYDSTINGNGIAWQFKSNALGCSFNKGKTSSATGAKAILNTPLGGTASPVVVVAIVDKSLIKLAPLVKDTMALVFNVSKNGLDSIRVKRVDSDLRGYVTNSSSEKAEFSAVGIDKDGKELTIAPVWGIVPSTLAGTISERGVFRPNRNFAGQVRVTATIKTISGEFNPQTGSKAAESGLPVHYIVPLAADSLKSASVDGMLTLRFPDTLFAQGKSAEIAVSVPFLKNRNERNTGEFTILGSAWEISEVNEYSFNALKKVRLELAMPVDYQTEAASGNGAFYVALWDNDSLQWKALANSQVSADGTVISTELEHFSRYAIMYRVSDLSTHWSIKPNPFSPYIQPNEEYGNIYGPNVPRGTCIMVTPVAQHEPIAMKLDIFTVTGERVLSSELANVRRNQVYYIWWNGKTTSEKTVNLGNIPNQAFNHLQTLGTSMCHNGRYFAVLTIRDGEDKEKKFMKPMVLFK